ASVCMILLVFFFSSRRRHTRFSRDWSSDVCSSDLADERLARPPGAEDDQRNADPAAAVDHLEEEGIEGRHGEECAADRHQRAARSEERRVGKECGSRGSAYYGKKKEERHEGRRGVT